MPGVRTVSLLSALLIAGACGGGDDAASVDAAAVADASGQPRADAAPRADAGPTADAGPAPDASTTPDATVPDAMIVPDADVAADAGACHALALGSPAVTLEQVTSLPTMTGGSISLGVYDLVAFKMISTTTTGTYRATWSVDSATVMRTMDQIALNGAPTGAPVPRTASYNTSGATLTQNRTCGDNNTLVSEYTVRTEGADTFLDVRQGTIMLTFHKRP